MGSIEELININYSSLFVAIFTILIGIKAIVSIFEWFISKLGLETKWMRKKREDHELLIQTAQNLTELQQKHIEDVLRSDQRDKEICDDIKKLTDMFIDKEIDDMRWEINNFATKVLEGKPCNKDSFKHCIHIYEKYEKILKEKGLDNGEVEISMELISDVYREKMRAGF